MVDNGAVSRRAVRLGRVDRRGRRSAVRAARGEQVELPVQDGSEHEGPSMAEHDRRSGLQEHNFTNKIVKIFLDSNLSLILILLATIVGLAALWLDAARGGSADRRAAGRHLCQLPRSFRGGSRATGRDAAGEDSLSDRRRRVRLLDEPRRPGDHHRPLLRRRRSRAEPGQALQEDRRKPGLGSGGRDWLGCQAGRNRRRAGGNADAGECARRTT